MKKKSKKHDSYRQTKKSGNSTRNRHTGHINAFKQMILDRGRTVEFSDRVHVKLWVGSNSGGITNIRQIH